MRNKKYYKVLSVALALAMTAGVGYGVSSYAEAKENDIVAAADNSGEEDAATEETSETEEKVTDKLTGAFDNISLDADKEETVYVIADANGNAEQTIVSEWLKNPEGKATIEDKSGLKDIENVKGDETFTQDGDKITWNANGNDIYYKGTTDKKLPVDVKVTYFLDGKEVTPEEIAGKSGIVKIRFDYTNNSKDGEVYTPFLMASGMMMSNDNFKNVTVTNGKTISEGNNTIVVGMGLPGLQESLGIDEETLVLPNYVEVTAYAEKFSLDMTLTVAVTGNLSQGENGTNISIDEIEDELDDVVGQFTDGATKLSDGIKAYTDGVSQLADGVEKVDDGAGTLYEGTKTVQNAVNEISNGTNTIQNSFEGDKGVINGSKQISNGLAQLNQALAGVSLPESAELTDEQKAQIKQQIVSDITTNLTANQANIAAGVDKNAVYQEATNAANSYAPSQETVASEAREAGAAAAPNQDAVLAEAYAFAANFGEAGSDTFNAAVQAYAAAYQSAYTSGYGSAYGTAYKSGYTYAFGKAYETAYGSGYGTGYVAGYKSGYSTAYQAGIKYGADLVFAGLKSYGTLIDTLKQNVAALANGSAQLDKGINLLYDGICKLNSGSQKLSSNLPTLTNGAKSLKDGTAQLKSGANKLNGASSELISGGNKLKDGVGEIKEKVDDTEKDAEEITDKIKLVVEAGKNYGLYGGISDDMTGNVKFIIKTGAVK